MLNTPIIINHLVIPNRLVLPPMATAKCATEGNVSGALCDYYAEKSKGGYIGLIITEHCFVNKEGKAGEGQMSIADDSMIPGLSNVVAQIHQNGACTFAQISHAGLAANPKITGSEPIGPSAVVPPKRPKPEILPKAITQEEIAGIKEAFLTAAIRAKAAGYDGVELHSAHGYLLNQFYSPLTNFRQDAYGGSLENRIRIHLEIIQAIRTSVGADYPIAIRLGACDYMEGGNTIKDAVMACQMFEQAGIDLLDISGSFYGYQLPGLSQPGYFKEASTAIRQNTSVPVLLTGGITTSAQAEELLQKGCADLIGVGRAILADSTWAERHMGNTC